jgi:HSP20 family protein
MILRARDHGGFVMTIDQRRLTSDFVPLRDIMQQLVEGSFITPQSFTGQGTFPPVDLFMTDDDVIVELAVPGARQDDIAISITGETVTVIGEVKRQQRTETGHGYAQEIWQGKFQRAFRLPMQIDADQAEASFEHGILTLRLPKAEATKPRKIEIGKHEMVSEQVHRILKGSEEKETVGTTTR